MAATAGTSATAKPDSQMRLAISKVQPLLRHADLKTTGNYLRPESVRPALDPRARLSAVLN